MMTTAASEATTSGSIADNLARVRERVVRAAAAAGRSAAEVKLVAVSKKKPVSAIREAYAAGQRDFGENYAQEFAAKAAELADLADLRWHFIGHLQSNKAKLVAGVCAVIHTVDSLGLAQQLARRAAAGSTPQAVLVEVNVGREPQKHGAAPEELGALLDGIAAMPELALRGLMTVPPRGVESADEAFGGLAALRREHGGAERLPVLSMGMSEDLEIAIRHGATLVRVGSAIFGAR